MEYELSKSRIEMLTDGIFAIVMTLLVLEIAVPQLTHPQVAAGELPAPDRRHPAGRARAAFGGAMSASAHSYRERNAAARPSSWRIFRTLADRV